MNFKDLFMHACVGVITAASVGTFTQVYELKTAIALQQEDLARTKSDFTKLYADIEHVKNEVIMTTIEVVKIKDQCEKVWAKAN